MGLISDVADFKAAGLISDRADFKASGLISDGADFKPLLDPLATLEQAGGKKGSYWFLYALRCVKLIWLSR